MGAAIGFGCGWIAGQAVGEHWLFADCFEMDCLQVGLSAIIGAALGTIAGGTIALVFWNHRH
ncbi:MAG: hypothetical protein ABI572_07935 [Actinomycetota bacterium]